MKRICGVVTQGSKVGRKLGYPTANINVAKDLKTPNGVYAAMVEHEGRGYCAMANLGVRPTVSESGERVLELHLFNFEGNLYGTTLTVELLHFIRPEQKFASTKELRAQIEIDKLQIEKILNAKQCI